jgi:metallo-beta-lactamase class B
VFSGSLPMYYGRHGYNHDRVAAALTMRFLRNRIFIAVAAGALALAVMGFIKWREASFNGGQKPATPFRIAGNLYYVGAQDVTSFLLTGPQGHVLIDGGYPGTAPMIMASIAKLGFDIRDVKILLNSHGHFDHAGGLAELQRASGAQLWISEREAPMIRSGGAANPVLNEPLMLPLKLLMLSGMIRYPAPRIDHTFKDGAVIRLGPIELTAHVIGGHTPGCTAWTFPVRDGDRELLAIDVNDLGVPELSSLLEPETYPGIRADFERGFKVLHSLPVDIFLTNHARQFGRWRKFVLRAHSKDPVAPFIDRQGYLDHVNKAEARFRKELARQQKKRSR